MVATEVPEVNPNWKCHESLVHLWLRNAVHKAHLRYKKMVVFFTCCNNYVQSHQGFNLTLTPFWIKRILFSSGNPSPTVSSDSGCVLFSLIKIYVRTNLAIYTKKTYRRQFICRFSSEKMAVSAVRATVFLPANTAATGPSPRE